MAVRCPKCLKPATDSERAGGCCTRCGALLTPGDNAA